MSHRQRRSLALDRQERAWNLYIAGRTQAEIATELGMSRPGVGKALARAEDAVVARMDDVVRTAKAKDLDRLDRIIGQSLRAWDKSKRTATKTVEKAGDDGVSVTTTRERSPGDPRFLRAAVDALDRKAILLGLDAPTNVQQIEPARPLAEVTEDDLRKELVEINRQLGITVPDKEPSIH